MTLNTLIALTNVSIAVSLLLLGGALLVRAWPMLREWPVPALVAIAGPMLTAALIFGQTSLWRLASFSGPLSPDGALTLLLRLACLVTVVALTRRVWRGQVLTDRDRRRLRESP